MAMGLRTKVLITAAIMGLLTAGLVYLFLTRQAKAASRPTPAVVARENIPIGSIIDVDMVEVKELPRNEIPPDAATGPEMVIGRVAAVEIGRGQIVRISSIAPKSRLSQRIPQSMRAVTVGIDPVTGVGGFLEPGDHVDVIGTFNVDGGTLTKVVLQDVLLLATGTQVIADQVAPPSGQQPSLPQAQPTATLAVTPDQAQVLILAASKGKLTLALRRYGDQTRTGMAGITGRAITGVVPPDVPPKETKPATQPSAAPPPATQPVAAQPPGQQTKPQAAPTPKPKPPAPKTRKITIIRGTKVEEVEVPK